MTAAAPPGARTADDASDDALEAVYHDTLRPCALHLVEAWARTRRWPPEHLLGLGAVTADRRMKDASGEWHAGPVIRVPCWEGGRMAHWQDRTPRGWQGAGLPKWLDPPRAARPPGPRAAGLDSIISATALHVVEGMTDYITATLLADDGEGVVAGLGAGAVAKLAGAIAERAAPSAVVRIHPHMDTPGIRGATALGNHLRDAGYEPVFHNPGRHGDLTEMHEAGIEDALAWDGAGDG